MLTVTLVSFHNYNDSILMERAEVGMEVLEDTVNDEINDLSEKYESITKDERFIAAVAEGNTNVFEVAMSEEFEGNEDFFMVIADGTGAVTYKTNNYPFKSFDYGQVARGKIIKGIAHSDSELAAVYAAPLTAGSKTYVMCVGFTMEATDWMETVKKLVGCDVTIFNDNIRYSSTFGSSVIGTPMVLQYSFSSSARRELPHLSSTRRNMRMKLWFRR